MRLSIIGGFFFIGGIMMCYNPTSSARNDLGSSIAVFGFILLCVSLAFLIRDWIKKNEEKCISEDNNTKENQ